MSLDTFFRPKNVAVIGASRDPKKFGHIVLENFIRSGFSGNVFPVNPNAEKIMDKRCYASVRDLDVDNIDLAIISIPAAAVLDAVRECVEKGVKSAIIITAGFSEIGRRDLEEKIMKIAEGKMRIIGPNVIGVYDAHSHVDCIFNPYYRQERPPPGGIAFVSQSGAFGTAILDWASSEGVGLSKFVSIGNAMDVDEIALLEYLKHDKQTSVIALYLEGTKHGRKLYETLKDVTGEKPVVVLKAGKTEAGQQAVMSHTGSLSGNAAVFSGMFKQAGVIEAHSSEELFDFAKALASQPPPASGRIQIVTNGGGFGVMASDAVVKFGLKLAELSKEEKNALRKHVPSYATVSNPLDLTGDADSKRFASVLDVVLKSDNVDGVIVILLMQISALETSIVKVLEDMKSHGKPILVCSTGGEFTNAHKKMLEDRSIPVFSTPDKASKAMKVLADSSKTKVFNIQANNNNKVME